MLRVACDEMTRARTLDNRTGVEISSMDSLLSSRASLNSGLQIIPGSMPKLRILFRSQTHNGRKVYPPHIHHSHKHRILNRVLINDGKARLVLMGCEFLIAPFFPFHHLHLNS